MIIKLFQVSTKEMFTFKNKSELLVFVYQLTSNLPSNPTINNLIHALPKNDFHRIK